MVCRHGGAWRDKRVTTLFAPRALCWRHNSTARLAEPSAVQIFQTLKKMFLEKSHCAPIRFTYLIFYLY